MPRKPQYSTSTKKLRKPEFVEGTPKFDKKIERIAKRFDIRPQEIWKELATLTHNPNLAKPIPNSNPLRKFRLPIPGRSGKSSGLRFICAIDHETNRIVPLEIFSKGNKADLSAKELKKLKKTFEDTIQNLRASMKK